jgi:hypothetical protein
MIERKKFMWREAMSDRWQFKFSRQERRSRRLILEGIAYPPYERPYYDDLFLYMVLGPEHISLETSRDFDGDNLIAFLLEQLGPPADGPRIQVGGRQDEEEGALMLVEWQFPKDAYKAMTARLEEIFGQKLEGSDQ